MGGQRFTNYPVSASVVRPTGCALHNSRGMPFILFNKKTIFRSYVTEAKNINKEPCLVMSFISWPRFQTIFLMSFLFSGNENIFQTNVNYMNFLKNLPLLDYIQNTKWTFLGSVITG